MSILAADERGLETDGEDCAALGRISRGQGAAVLRDDAVSEGEADAVTFGLGGEKGDEDLLKIGG